MAVLEAQDLNVRFGEHLAVRDVDLERRRRQDRRPDRPERRRQDHDLQRHLRRADVPRHGPPRRRRHLRGAAPPPRPPRDEPHLPAPRGVRVDDGVRQHPHRRRDRGAGAPPIDARRRGRRRRRSSSSSASRPSPTAAPTRCRPARPGWSSSAGRSPPSRRCCCSTSPPPGLDEVETARLAEVLARLADDGMAVLLVEHDMDLVMQLCSRICVLNFGEVIASGHARARSGPHPAVQERLPREPGVANGGASPPVRGERTPGSPRRRPPARRRGSAPPA